MVVSHALHAGVHRQQAVVSKIAGDVFSGILAHVKEGAGGQVGLLPAPERAWTIRGWQCPWLTAEWQKGSRSTYYLPHPIRVPLVHQAKTTSVGGNYEPCSGRQLDKFLRRQHGFLHHGWKFFLVP